MRILILTTCFLALSVLNGACAFNKRATKWNQLVGPDGTRVYLNSTTKIGFNALIFIPAVGHIDVESMVDEATAHIRTEGGDYVRVIQSHTDNYWYAFPPVTWVMTPVVHSLIVEYRPDQHPSSPQPPQDYNGWESRP